MTDPKETEAAPPEEASADEVAAEETATDAEAAPHTELAAPDLEATVADLNDKLLRALSEAENTRRRAARQVEDASKYAVANFAREMLSVGDNLRRALDSVDAEARKKDEALENLCVGIEMTEKAMLDIFAKMGIKPVETEGKRFDPNVHEAMFEVENPAVPHGSILQVIRSGYTLGDRLLRSAQVGVAKGGPKGVPDGPKEAERYDAHGEPLGETKGVNLDENL